MGCSSKSNVNITQRFQSKALRTILNAPWYVSNRTHHVDTNIQTVADKRQKRFDKHLLRLQAHSNDMASNLSHVQNPKRLKRSWPSDLKSD